jgi:hypothetical protein
VRKRRREDDHKELKEKTDGRKEMGPVRGE